MVNIQADTTPYHIKLMEGIEWVSEVNLSFKIGTFSLGVRTPLVTLLQEGWCEVELIPRLPIEGPNWRGYYYPTLDAVVAVDLNKGRAHVLSPSINFVFTDVRSGQEFTKITISNKKIQLKDLNEDQPFDWESIRKLN